MFRLGLGVARLSKFGVRVDHADDVRKNALEFANLTPLAMHLLRFFVRGGAFPPLGWTSDLLRVGRKRQVKSADIRAIQ